MLKGLQRAARGAAVATVAAVAGIAAMTELAGAADLPRATPYTAPAPISSYSWTGPYLGGNLGY